MIKRILFIVIIISCLHSAYSQTRINIQDISKHIGEKVTVCSKVFGVKLINKSGVTFINVGAAYPSSPLTIVIFKKDKNNFKKSPDQLYANKNICVTGTITQYEGKSEMIISSPESITVQ